eukprot:13688593-Heterocapsa_arctica.AAC.1
MLIQSAVHVVNVLVAIVPLLMALMFTVMASPTGVGAESLSILFNALPGKSSSFRPGGSDP